MNISKQKRIEYAHLLAFKDALSDFPSGAILINSEKPDFIVKSEGKTVGIEHTQLLHGHRSDGSHLKATETYVMQIIARAKELFLAQVGTPVMVSVSFSTRPRLTKHKVESLARQLSDIVADNLPEPESTSLIKKSWTSGDPLPEEFSTVWIVRSGSMTKSVWGPIMGGYIPQIPAEFIRACIQHKNERVETYRIRCDTLWLLITVEGFLPSSWFDIPGEALDYNFNSDFDRVYVFDFQNRKAVRLRIGGTPERNYV